MVDDGKRLQEKCAERRNRNPVGRPKGGSLAQQKVNALLESRDFEKALAALGKVASDPDHKHWAAAIKMLMERGAHLSNFEKKGSGSTPTININIGETNSPVTIDGETVDG